MLEVPRYEGRDQRNPSQTSILLYDRGLIGHSRHMAMTQEPQQTYPENSALGVVCTPTLIADLAPYDLENRPRTVRISAELPVSQVSPVLPQNKALSDWTLIKDFESTAEDFYPPPWHRSRDVFRSGISDTVLRVRPAAPYIDRSATGAVPETILTNWRALNKSSFSDATYRRLLHLASMGQNWAGADSLPLAPASLGRFLEFWQGVSDQAIEPEFVLTLRGTLQAEWCKDSTHLLEIDFAIDKNETCYFGLFDGRRATIEGGGKIDDVVHLCMAYRKGVALRWGEDSA